MSLQGNLSEFPIGELLQTLTLNNHEGTLKIAAASEKDGDRYFYLSKGEIQLVSMGRRGLRLGEALIKAKKITQKDLDRALNQHSSTGRMLGRTLVELKLIAEEDIEQVIQQQFREEFFELFLLTKGGFEFFFRTKPDQLVQFDPTVSRVSMNTSGLMLEALRQIDEWQVMSKKITTPRAILKVEAEDLDAAVAELGTAEDVARAKEHIDGRRPVSDIVEKTAATKFDVYSFLYQLVEAGAIRPLDAAECRAAAEACEESGDTYAATLFYDFGVFLAPDDVDLRTRQFRLLKRLAVYREAKEAALAVADAKLEAKAHAEALEFYGEALACDEKDLHAREGIFKASFALGTDRARTQRACDDFVRAAIRLREHAKARDALRAVCEQDQLDFRRRVQLADLQEDDDEGRAKAVKLLEEAIAGLVRPEDASLKAEAARKLLQLDQRREDAQTTLKDAVAQAESNDRAKVRRIVLLNVIVVLLLVGVYFGSRELAAQAAFEDAEQAAAHAEAIAEIEDASFQMRSIALRYPYSTVTARAEAEVARLKEKRARKEKEEAAQKAEEAKRRAAGDAETRKQIVIELLRRADAAERRGALQEAAEARLEIAKSYQDVKLDQKLRLPVPVTSDPPGARILRGQEDVGVTPAVITIEPLRDTPLRLESSGYKPVERLLRGDRFEEVKAALERAPLWTFRSSGAIEGALIAKDARVHGVSRGGEAFALELGTGASLWRAKLGEYGDRLSTPAWVSGKIVVGASEGRTTALDPATGQPLWHYETDGAVRGAATASADGLLVALGSLDGLAHILRAADGRRVFTVKVDQRIDAAIPLAGGRAFIAARDGRLLGVNAATGGILWTYSSPEGFVAAPLVLGDLVIAGARDGTVTAVGAEDGKPLWRVATSGRVRAGPAASLGAVIVPGEDGKVVALDATKGGLIWTFTADGPVVCSPVVAERGIYVAATSGTVFRLDPRTGKSDWSFPVGSAVYASPAVADGKVLIGAADGSVHAVLE